MSLSGYDQLTMSWAADTDSFYPDGISDDMKLKELDYDCEENGSHCGSHSGGESPHTLTNLTDVGCITGNANALLSGDDSGFEDRFTDSSDPKMWTHWQVQCWLKQLSEKLAVGVDLNIFLDLNGESLCQMTMEDFINRDHTVGGMVYNELQQLQYSQTTYPYVSQNNYYPNFPTDFRGGETLDSFGRLIAAYEVDGTETLPSLPAVAPPLVEKSEVKVEPSSCSPVESSEESDDDEEKASVCSRPSGRRSNKGKGKLWEFIRDLLLNAETCPSIIKWENRSEGIFRIVKSGHVADLWGKRKGNASMTYEKMSRAMRYYYKKGVLERIECRRLVYKFGSSSRGWQI